MVDVDQHGGLSQPELHERDEAVAAGENFSIVAVLL
jgi:hypothetical protein